MKTKILTMLLFSSLVCLAQTGNQNTPNKTPGSDTQGQSNQPATSAGCKEMAGNMDAMSCCHHDSAVTDAKRMPCCEGKVTMPGVKDKSKPGENGSAPPAQKEPDQNSKQVAMSCCGVSAGGHCGMQHHDHDSIAK